MAVAHKFKEKDRTTDVLIAESVDFSGLFLSRDVLKGLQDAGFQKPSPIQLKAIPLGRCGLDLIVQAKSGTGKTCVFTVIALENVDVDFLGMQVLVLAPTREIALQIEDVVKTVGKSLNGLRCHTFIGGLPALQDKVFTKKCHIAIGTPGRVKHLIETGAIDTSSIRLFVLDEADILLKGDFQEPINWIYSSLPENKQILALSATYPEYLAHHLTAYMRNPTFVRLNSADPALLGIKQFYISVPNHALPNVVYNSKAETVIKLLSSINFQQCLIFSNMQTRAKNLQSELQSRKWPTACIAGCLDQKERNFAMEQLKTYKCRILISTDLTSRGIDADKVNLVINMDIPADHETYLHRIGRGGRFGSRGAAITIITEESENKKLRNIEKKCNTRIKKLPEPIPKDLIARVETISLDEIVTSEQIINKPMGMPAEAGDKSESVSQRSNFSTGPSDSFEAAFDSMDETVRGHQNCTDFDNAENVNIDCTSDNVCETKGALIKSADKNCAYISQGLSTNNTSLSNEVEEKKTLEGIEEEIPVDLMPRIVPEQCPDTSSHEMKETETLEDVEKEILVDPMPHIVPEKCPDASSYEIEEKKTLEGIEEITVDPMSRIVPENCPDTSSHEMEEKKTLEGGEEEFPVDMMLQIVPEKCPDTSSHEIEEKTLEGSEEEIPVDTMLQIVPEKCPDTSSHDMEEKKTLESSEEEIPVDPIPRIVPEKCSDMSLSHEMEEKKTLEGSEEEIPLDTMLQIVPEKCPDTSCHDMEEKKTLEGSEEEIPLDPMSRIVPEKCSDMSLSHEMEEKKTLEGGEEEMPVDPILLVPNKCSQTLPVMEVNNIDVEPDNTETLKDAGDILCNEVLKYTKQHVNISEEPKTSCQEDSSLFSAAQPSTAVSLLQTNVKGKEDGMENPSPVSDLAKNDKTFRHRRRAPRSYAVSDFLQSVNDDLLALRIKDVGAGGDSLKCNPTTFSASVHSSDRTPMKSDEIIGQVSPRGKGTGNQIRQGATSMTQPPVDATSGSAISTDEMCGEDTSLLAPPKSSLIGDTLDITEPTLSAHNNAEPEESSEAMPYGLASAAAQKQNTHVVPDIGTHLTHTFDIECVNSSVDTENTTELNTSHVDTESTTEITNKSRVDTGSLTVLTNKSHVDADLMDNASAIRKSSNSSGKPSAVDFNEVTNALNLYLAQRLKGHCPSSFDDLVADHNAFSNDKDNVNSPELSHLFEHLELKDTVNWQEVFDYNTKKIEDFQADFNEKLKASEAERLSNKDSAEEKTVKSKSQRATIEASHKSNNLSGSRRDEENSEELISHQGKGKGKKQKNKSHRPSDSLDWRSPNREHGPQWNDKVISPDKKCVGKVEKSEHSSTSTAQQIARQTSKAGSQTSVSSTLDEIPSESGSRRETGKVETCERVARQPGQQRPRGKDKECQALDDMHEIMMKRRQEQKRLKQQNLNLDSAGQLAKEDTEKVIISAELKTDPIKESQEFNKEVCQESINEVKESLMHNSTEQVNSFIRAQQADVYTSNKPLVESCKEHQDVSNTNIKNISVQYTNIDDVKLNQNIYPDEILMYEVKKSVSTKRHQANSSKGAKVMTTCTEKTKLKKPSKTQARLAGLEVSAGSTSSSSYFSLTSDISDVVLSDMERENQLLKPHCYANKYVEDETCLLNDSKMSTASAVSHSYYSKEDAYLRDYSISCSSPFVPKTLPSPNLHRQHYVQQTEESDTNLKLKVGVKSPKEQPHHKRTKSPRCSTKEKVTGDLQNDLQQKDSKHYHKNSTEKKQMKRSSFPSLQSCESDTESDYSTSRHHGASSRRRPSHYPSLAWQHLSFEPLDSFGNRAAAQPLLPHYSTFQPVFSPYMYPPPMQYFPQEYYYTAMYHQGLLQSQYIKTMTKVMTDLHKQWCNDNN